MKFSHISCSVFLLCVVLLVIHGVEFLQSDKEISLLEKEKTMLSIELIKLRIEKLKIKQKPNEK